MLVDRLDTVVALMILVWALWRSIRILRWLKAAEIEREHELRETEWLGQMLYGPDYRLPPELTGRAKK